MNGEGQQLETCNNEAHSGHNVRCPHSTFRPYNKKNTWINNCLDTASIHLHKTFVQSLGNVNFWAESLMVLFLQIELVGIPRIFLCFVVCLSYYWSFCGTNWEDYVRPKISLRVFLLVPSAAELRHLLHIARLCCDTATLVCGGNLAVLLCDRPTILSRSRSCRLYAWRQPMIQIILQILLYQRFLYIVPLNILAVVRVDEVVIWILVHFNFHHAVFTVVLKSGEQLSDWVLRLLNTILCSDCCIVSAESSECFLTTSLQLYYSIITTTSREKLFL